VKSVFDAVIVGSGFGGGVTACRLAENGWHVCVLERGRRFGPGDFPDSPDQAPFSFWHRLQNPGGFFDLRLMKDLAVLTAAGVGGGSLVDASAHVRAPSGVFEGPEWPEAISRSELDRYYDRAAEAFQPRPIPGEPELPKVRAFAALGQRSGHSAREVPLAIHFGEDRRNPFSGVLQQGCQNLGRCDTGCPIFAKNSVDITYMARAEAHGAEVYPGREVTRIESSTQHGAWRVGFRDLQHRVGGAVEGRVLVLAAGALGSTRLLFENRRRLRTLSPALGSRFTGNGDPVGFILAPAAPGVAGANIQYGPSITSWLDYADERGLIVVDGSLPGHVYGLGAIISGVSRLSTWGRLVLRAKGIAVRVGFTDRPVSSRNIRMKARRDVPISDSLVFLMIGRDVAAGRMRLSPIFRCFDVQMSKQTNAALFETASEVAMELGAAAEGAVFYAVGAGPLNKSITMHPLGGCPMSDDPAHGVVDDQGRVYGYETMYVLDGSIVPTGLAVSPAATIAALAERGVERMLAEDT
jgi:cholesterol oxidase